MALQVTTQRCDREGTFQWKIDGFDQLLLHKERKRVASHVFNFSKWKCHLFIPERDGSCKLCFQYYPVCLAGVDISEFCNETFFYKLSFVGRRGKEFLEADHSTLQLVPPNILLTVIHYNYLKENRIDLIPDDRTLTFRFSWYGTQDRKCEQDTHAAQYPTLEKESIKCLETLSEDLGRFYESRVDTDCVIRVGESEFSVHRQVLSARSDVFAATFRYDTLENRSGVVNIPDVDAVVMSDVIHYVYSGQVRGLTSDTAVSMYTIADKYALLELKEICLNFLMHNLTIENFYAAALLAHTHGEANLETKIVQFMEDRLEDVKESDEFKALSINKPSLAIQLLCSTVFACKEKTRNENFVLKSTLIL